MRARRRLNRALMLGLVSVSVMSTARGASAAAAARRSLAVEPGHPRIFFTAKDLPALKKRIQTTHRTQWAGMKRWADSRVDGTWSNTQLRQQLPTYAFLYRLGGERKHADEAISMARRIAAFDIGALVKGRRVSKGDVSAGDLEGTPKAMAIAYDWCHDRLTAADKAAILKGLDAHCGWLLKNRIEPHTHPMNNHRSTSACSMAMGGLAMHGDHPNAERYAAAALRVCEEFVCIHRHFSAPGDGMAGCEGGSMEYTRHALIPTFMMIEAFRSATGNDLFAPEFENYAYGTLYATYLAGANKPTMLRIGDGKWGGVGSWERKYLSMLASRCRNRHAQWYVNHMTKPNTGGEAWYDILWYDPAVPETPPDALPLARHFQAMGEAVVRTGWYEPDATVVSFKCGDYFSGHGHLDQNSFTIYRKGHLAIDSGGYDSWYSPHWRNYYSRTVAHNTVTIFDPDEDRATHFGGNVNDGGQLFLYWNGGAILRKAVTDTGGIATDPKLDTGDIVVFEPGQGYVRVLGDATRAYSAHKLKNFTRELVVLHPKNKTNPPAIVVFDRVRTTRPEYAKKWLLHTADKPDQIGPDTWRATEADGTLYVSMLEPRGAKVTLVGGPGREFEVNGVNYPLPEKDASNRPPNVPGSWRIEVRPPKPAERDLFLNVLLPADKDQTSIPAVSRVETASTLGGFVKGERGEPDTIVWFARNGDVLGAGESVSYRIQGNGEVRHLVTDLPANVAYAIRLDGRTIQTLRTQDARTHEGARKGLVPSCSLSFTTPTGAGRTITIAPVRH